MAQVLVVSLSLNRTEFISRSLYVEFFFADSVAAVQGFLQLTCVSHSQCRSTNAP